MGKNKLPLQHEHQRWIDSQGEQLLLWRVKMVQISFQEKKFGSWAACSIRTPFGFPVTLKWRDNMQGKRDCNIFSFDWVFDIIREIDSSWTNNRNCSKCELETVFNINSNKTSLSTPIFWRDGLPNFWSFEKTHYRSQNLYFLSKCKDFLVVSETEKKMSGKQVFPSTMSHFVSVELKFELFLFYKFRTYQLEMLRHSFNWTIKDIFKVWNIDHEIIIFILINPKSKCCCSRISKM